MSRRTGSLPKLVTAVELNAHWVQRSTLVDGHTESCSCIACGRVLRGEKSIERGMGPVCYRKSLAVDTRTLDLFA